MLEFLMFIALGFLIAGVLAVLLARPLWRRAVRLTTRRIEATMPMTVADIQADKDELRAEFAIKLRQLELSLEKAKDQSARHLVERNRNQVLARQYKDEVASLGEEISARSSQTTVLQQNVSGRIPKLEEQNAQALETIAARETELDRLKQTLADQSNALNQAKRELEKHQQAEKERLDVAEYDQSANADVNALQAENNRLLEEMNTLRKHLSSADAEALEALKIEKQNIETELSELKTSRASLDLRSEAYNGSAAKTSRPAAASEADVTALKHEIQNLADEIMENAKAAPTGSERKPATRNRKSRTAKKSTAAKSAKKKAPTNKSRKSPLTQRIRELADSQAD